MKCPNCKKKIKPSDSFCDECGKEIIKGKKQIFKIIMILFITGFLILNTVLLYLLLTTSPTQNVEEMFQNQVWLVLNIFTLFIPTIIYLLFHSLGGFGIFLANVLCIILSLLTMIRASKTKKYILLVLIILFIILSVIAILSSI